MNCFAQVLCSIKLSTHHFMPNNTSWETYHLLSLSHEPNMIACSWNLVLYSQGGSHASGCSLIHWVQILQDWYDFYLEYKFLKLWCQFSILMFTTSLANANELRCYKLYVGDNKRKFVTWWNLNCIILLKWHIGTLEQCQFTEKLIHMRLLMQFVLCFKHSTSFIF